MMWPSFITTTALVRRNGGWSGSAKARSSAVANAGLCGRDDQATGDLGQQRRLRLAILPAANGGDSGAVIEIATGALAIDGVGPAEANMSR